MCIPERRVRSNANIGDTVYIIVFGNNSRKNDFKWIASAPNRSRGDQERAETRADHEKCTDRSAKDTQNCKKKGKTPMFM